ncbi:hypothetical protein, variant [Verruconis gallopava]|nr:hypothetical protein, variant [Verruconis gallopava]KIW04097.1 hypothetical protein, variant [Verruconis gallopava]
MEFLRTIRASKDKTGRSIVEAFLTLPKAEEVPGYYDQIKLPIALDTIENKLKQRAYPTLTALESDFKRMVQNAKDFNDKRSLIYEDAERVRKGASNWFVRNNPAYGDRNYVAKPTPIPDDANGAPSTPGPISLKITNKAAPVRMPVVSTTSAPAGKGDQAEADEDAEGEVEELPDFAGKTFQEAQEQLLEELINYEDGDLQIFTPFHFLPPRALHDYYQLIKYPVSLKGIQKRVRGKHGKEPATGKSDFQTWDALEEELSYIWKNCREYNEDGSDMYNLAGEFEEICKQRLELARSQVEQPAQTKIKLNLGAGKAAPAPSIKLKFGSKQSPGTQSPAETPATERGTPGITVDNDALQRQKDMVAASVNGARSGSTANRNAFGGSRSGSVSTPIPGVARRASGASPPVQTNGVKAEDQSPALSAVRPTTAASNSIGTASMPPPAGVNSRPVSGSPHPQLQPPIYQTAPPPTNQYQPPPAVNNFMQSKLRPEGQTIKDSILPTLTIISHPGIQTSTPFKQVIKAHPRLIEQSFTYTVPATKYLFHIIPYLPPSVTSRAYRIFVLVNGSRLSPRANQPGEDQDKSRPVYEARLERGTVGRIEVEVLAEKAKGERGKDEVDREKVSVFMHVLRS